MTGGVRGEVPRPAVWCAIAVACVAVYEPVRSFPFVVFDDKAYVSENPMVNAGLGREAVWAAFRHDEQGNWVPLAWISHQLDVTLFGLDARGHHLVSALLHLASSLLLFEALRSLSGSSLPSAFCALVFAIHPAHVESVAWVAERRDTLSGVFWMLTLLAWSGWARRRSKPAYAAALLCFALGLLAKPMLVTLPFVLLLLDLWPLRRSADGPRRLLLEKLPLFGLAAAVAWVALASQGSAGAVASLDQVPLATRLANALVSCVAYLGKTLWPTGLAVFYPYDLAIPLWKVASAALLLAGLSGLASWQVRRRPWLLVGWLWYLGTLAPVIGLVQIGSQAMADRYTYLPMIGLTLAVAWEAQDRAARSPAGGRALAGAAIVWLALCLPLARTQVWTWRDSETLFEHARRLTGDNAVVLANLAEAHDDAGRVEQALVLYQASLEHHVGSAFVHERLGALFAARGQLGRAAAHLERTIALAGDRPGPHLQLGKVLLRAGRPDDSRRELERARALDPDSASAAFHLGELDALAGDGAGAQARFAEAFALDPELPDAPLADKSVLVAASLAQALAAAGRGTRAVYWGGRALALAQLAGDPQLAAQLARELESYQAAQPR